MPFPPWLYNEKPKFKTNDDWLVRVPLALTAVSLLGTAALSTVNDLWDKEISPESMGTEMFEWFQIFQYATVCGMAGTVAGLVIWIAVQRGDKI